MLSRFTNSQTLLSCQTLARLLHIRIPVIHKTKEKLWAGVSWLVEMSNISQSSESRLLCLNLRRLGILLRKWTWWCMRFSSKSSFVRFFFCCYWSSNELKMNKFAFYQTHLNVYTVNTGASFTAYATSRLTRHRKYKRQRGEVFFWKKKPNSLQYLTRHRNTIVCLIQTIKQSEGI